MADEPRPTEQSTSPEDPIARFDRLRRLRRLASDSPVPYPRGFTQDIRRQRRGDPGLFDFDKDVAGGLKVALGQAGTYAKENVTAFAKSVAEHDEAMAAARKRGDQKAWADLALAHPVLMGFVGSVTPAVKGIRGRHSFTEDEISIATSTARSAGAIGPRALVPRTVQKVASPDDTILDFGAGPEEAHAQNLREDGFNVTAWDFGKNPEAIYRQYDIVYASNVLNVQSSLDMLERTVGQIAGLVRPGGTFIGNLPLSPRKFQDLNPQTLETILSRYFTDIERVGGKSNAPVYMAKKAQEEVRKAHGGFIDKPLYERTL